MYLLVDCGNAKMYQANFSRKLIRDAISELSESDAPCLARNFTFPSGKTRIAIITVLQKTVLMEWRHRWNKGSTGWSFIPDQNNVVNAVARHDLEAVTVELCPGRAMVRLDWMRKYELSVELIMRPEHCREKSAMKTNAN